MGRAEGGSCCDSPSLAHHAARFEGRGLSSIGTPSEVVSVTTGVLNPLIGKLTKLLGGEYNNKLTGVMREQASSLKDELSAIKPLLDKMELTDDLDASARNWRDRVRETSYDMENCIDEFMHNTDGATDAEASFVEKMASRIEELKVLAVEANARRREMCKHDDDAINNSTHAHVVADSPISAIRKEVAVLVGIDGPREELVVLLTDPQIELKVVSIVGSAGSGKTTLAMQVYDEIEAQFDCTTFVSASRRPDVESLLGRLLLNLGMTEFSRTLELHEIIDCLREHLEHKRYFILVDDLWDQSAWNIMRCAFPENSNGSRMIVTTRLDDVAVNACHNDHACIYRMKHLEEQDSRNLFFNRVFGSNNVCPPQFQYISAEIFKKCGGLPLAIVTIAGLLASTEARSLNEWESIKKALGAMSATKPTLEEMRGILNLSYMHLPVYLRPCLLYLGMYPEDREIWRDDLVKQWIDGTMLPKGIQNMKLVRTLHCSGMSEGSLEDIKGLSELTNLKELELSTPYGQCLTVEGVDTLISSIGLVRDLKHLMLDCDSECDGYERLSDSLSDPPPCLEYLDLETWKLSRVPRWIGELSCLRFLHLFVLHLSSDEVCVLGELPSLISAMLHVSEVSKNKVVVGAGLFPLLEVFWFQSNEDVSTYLSFEAGAMPKLQKLKLGFGWQEWRGATPVGMECLPCLRDIRVWLRYTVLQSSKNEKDVRADVESAFKCAVRRYPKHTSVVVD
ncbi:hypothetical protein ACQ4PT_031994 [Festuca glaucescens]